MGSAGAVISGLGSIYNTAATAANFFGADIDEIDTAKVLGQIDQNWRKYYEENQSVIDTVGFIGGAFIPGGIAVKGLNLAKQGKAFGSFGRALGAASRKEKEYLEMGLQAMAQDAPSAFSSFNRSKLLSMTYGAADNVLEAAVFEAAAITFMSRNPVLADEDWKDIAWDFTTTSLLGGAIGGGIAAIWTNKVFRDAGKAIEKGGREYDTFSALQQLDLVMGDRAYGVVDEWLNKAGRTPDDKRILPFNYRLNGKDNKIDLEVGSQYDRKGLANKDRIKQTFVSELTNAVKSDPSIGAPYAASMLEIIKQGEAAGKNVAEIKQRLGDYLFNLESVSGLGTNPNIVSDVFYLVPGASLKSGREGGPLPMSPVRPSNDAVAYKVIGNEGAARSGVIGDKAVGNSVKEAWERGYDMVFVGKEGKIKINPASKIFKAFDKGESEYVQSVFNVRNNTLTDFPIATIADMATTANGVNVNATGVTAGRFTYSFSLNSFTPSVDSIENSARALWASELKSLKNVTIQHNDFALLDRAMELAKSDPDALQGIKFAMPDGSIKELKEVSLPALTKDQKLQALKELMEAGEGQLDARQAAYAINAELKFVEDAIKHQFDSNKLFSHNGFHRELNSYYNRDNIILSYRKPPIADPEIAEFPDALLGYQQRVTLAKETAQRAAAAALEDGYSRFIDLKPGQLTNEFDATGVGSTGLSSSNANYFDIARVWSQDVGRATHLTIKDKVNKALTAIQPLAAKVINSNHLELGAVVQRLRQTGNRTRIIQSDGQYLIVESEKAKLFNELSKRLEENPMDRDAREALQSIQFHVRIPVSDETAEFLSAFQGTHREWLNKQTTLAAAQGRKLSWDADDLYIPPVDTQKVPFYAFVKSNDGKIFGGKEVAMITAKSAEDLKAKADSLLSKHEGLEIHFKGDTEAFYKAKGEFDMQSAMNSPVIDSMLRREGMMGDVLPTLEPKAIVEEFVRYIGKRESQLVRSAVQLNYGETFANLRWLSDQYTKLQKSKFRAPLTQEQTKLKDPFGDYMRMALDISKKSEFTIWEQANSFVDAIGTRAYGMIEQAWREAKEGKTDWQDANAVLQKVGLPGMFESQADYISKQTGATDRNLIKLAVAKGNLLLSNITLRLDFANSLINIISTPIMLGTEVQSIRTSLKRDPELLTKFNEALSVATPGVDFRVPSTTKLILNATNNFFGKDKAALLKRYTNEIGSVRNDAQLFHEMLDGLALTPNMDPKKWAKKVDEWTEKGATLTGNNFAETFARFVASDVMRQITDPLVAANKMGIKEQNAFISIFTNRVHGNYITSQRPIAFQGTLGGAISLFQTYMFNMFQQLYRHIENRDAKTLAVAAGLQTTIFGLNGLPMFDAINTHIIGNAHINEQHHDIYSRIAAMDKKWGDTLLFGFASATPFDVDGWPGLFTRGDLNPRHLTIVPTSAANIPIVEASGRLLGAVAGIGSQISSGSEVSTALLHGLAHNGISRPLAGLATIAQGESTTSKGGLIAAHNDLISVASAARMLGAKPVDEAVALNHMFRMNAYKAADRERIEKLGTSVKQKIRDGSLTDEDVTDFMARYAQVGGRLDGFSAAMQRWAKGANESTVNTIMRSQSSVFGQRLKEVMGGDELPDYQNATDE